MGWGPDPVIIPAALHDPALHRGSPLQASSNLGSIWAPIAFFTSQNKPVSGSVYKYPQIGLIFENGQNKTHS